MCRSSPLDDIKESPKGSHATSPWRRIGAFAVDYVVLIVPLMTLISGLSWGLAWFQLNPFSINVWLNQVFVFLTLTLPVMLYFACCEASPWQATIGKRIAKVRVCDTNGRRPSLSRTTMRAIFKFLPWEFFHTIFWHWPGWPTHPAPPTTLQMTLLIVGWLVIGSFLLTLFVGSHRTPYDWLAGTVVVETAD